MIKIAFRNLLRSPSRTIPVFLVLFFSFFLLVLGNSLIEHSYSFFESVFVDYLSGDAVISAADSSGFGLFGPDDLILSNVRTAPPLPRTQSMRAFLESQTNDLELIPITSTLALLEFQGYRWEVLAHGTEIPNYFSFFQNLEVVEALSLSELQNGIALNLSLYNSISDRIGRKLRLGEVIEINSGGGGSFSLRQAPLVAIYKYPFEEAISNRMVLVDAKISQALANYSENINVDDLGEAESALLFQDVDDLFSDSLAAKFESLPPSDMGIETDLSGLFDIAIPESNVEFTPVWSHFLVRFYDGTNVNTLQTLLSESQKFENETYKVQSWDQSIGGNMQIAQSLQTVMNIGLFIISFATLLIASNAMSISVQERQRELATMRALGANGSLVIKLLVSELFILLYLAAIMGIVFSMGALTALSNTSMGGQNEYVQILFGNDGIKGSITVELLVRFFIFTVFACLFSMVSPIRRLRRITVRQAMK